MFELTSPEQDNNRFRPDLVLVDKHLSLDETEADLDFPSQAKLPLWTTDLKRSVVVVIGFLIANSLYLLVDRRCPYDDATQCAEEYIFPNITWWAIAILIIATIFTLVMYNAMRNNIRRIYIIAVVANIIYLSFLYNPKLNKRNYGQVFGFFLIIAELLCWTVLGIFLGLRLCYRKCRYMLVVIPIIVIGAYIVFYKTVVAKSCNEWTHGLAGNNLVNQGEYCHVDVPDVCVYEMTEGMLDLSRLFPECSSFEADEEIMQKYYTDAPFAGFPRTEGWKKSLRIPLQVIQKTILDHIVPLQSLNDPAAADLEIFLNKTGEQPTLEIKVKRNETLVKERAKVPQDKSLAKNVLVIYIDALSRNNALRKLKKTMKWFEQFSDKKKDKEFFQFFRYHSIAPFTYFNLYEALYGHHPTDAGLSKDHPIDSYLSSYKDNGFITGHATDFCQTTPFDIDTRDRFLKDTPYDHEAITLACDPHYHDFESAFGIFKGPYSSVRRCLYGKEVTDYVYEYGDQFWRTYKNEKKILYLDFLVAHEGTGEVVKYMDDPLHDFLNNLQKDGLLEDTAIIMYADHGLHMQGVYHLLGFDQVPTEISLPALFAIMPKSVTEKHGKDIKNNQQKLVSAHEVHHTLRALAEGENSASLKQGLLGSIPSHRNCTDIGVLLGKCACEYEEDKKHKKKN